MAKKPADFNGEYFICAIAGFGWNFFVLFLGNEGGRYALKFVFDKFQRVKFEANLASRFTCKRLTNNSQNFAFSIQHFAFFYI